MNEPGNAAAAVGQRRAGGGQRPVAGVVPAAVVDVLEAVEVAEQQRELAPGASAARDGRLEPLVERAPVRQPRERVLVGERLQPREQLGAPDRGRHLRAQRLREAHVRRRERRRADVGVGLEHAPHAVVEADRRGERGAAPDALEVGALLVGQRRRARARSRTGRPRSTSARSSAVSAQVSFAGRSTSPGVQLAGVEQRAHRGRARAPSG